MAQPKPDAQEAAQQPAAGRAVPKTGTNEHDVKIAQMQVDLKREQQTNESDVRIAEIRAEHERLLAKMREQLERDALASTERKFKWEILANVTKFAIGGGLALFGFIYKINSEETIRRAEIDYGRS